MTHFHSEPTRQQDLLRQAFGTVASLPGEAAHSELLATIAKLRAFAHLLSMDPALGDRLVEATLLRASVGLSQHHLGTNTLAWLCARLRSYFYSDHVLSRPGGAPRADHHHSLLAAFAELAAEHREALLLIEAMGFSTQQAARICRCPFNQFRARLTSARRQFMVSLTGSSPSHLTPAASAA